MSVGFFFFLIRLNFNLKRELAHCTQQGNIIIDYISTIQPDIVNKKT